jgi:hypothetical protein
VNPAMTVGRIAPGFVGLSYEKSHLTDGFFTGSNAPLIALCKLLGPSVLRIGGNSVDATTWDAGALPASDGGLAPTIGTADVDALADFLAATGWKTIYAVGLKHSTPAAAATEATYAASKLGSAVLGFEIGNEIDLYGVPETQLFANWEGEADAIRAAVPSAVLTGPAMAANDLVPAFAQQEAKRISLLTQHYYRDDGQSASATMDELLAPDPNLQSILTVMSTAVGAAGVSGGFRIDECNSYYNHGAPFVSNAFGSALWVLDFLFANALSNAAGVNFHGGGAGQDGTTPFLYTPIAELGGVVSGVKPIFYGMLLFTLAGTGDVLATTANAGAVNFTAYAVSQADGSTNVVLVNKDETTAVETTLTMGADVTAASAQRLLSPSLLALSGTTLGGADVSVDGAWTAGTPEALVVAGKTVTVNLPAASAAIVHVK